MAKGCEFAGAQCERIKGGKSPILSARIERIGRCTDCYVGHQGILIAPGIKTIRPDPNGHIEIKPDRQAGITRMLAAVTELVIGEPLHELEESGLLGIRSIETVQQRIARSAPWIGPLRPGTAEALTQQLETGEASQRWAAPFTKAFEAAPPLGI